MTKENRQHSHTDKQSGMQDMHNMQASGQDPELESREAQEQAERKRANARTEAEAQSIDGKAGQSGKSSHNHMGHIKAGTHEGAGGAVKSKRHH